MKNGGTGSKLSKNVDEQTRITCSNFNNMETSYYSEMRKFSNFNNVGNLLLFRKQEINKRKRMAEVTPPANLYAVNINV